MTPGTLEDNHLAVALLHFSLPLKHNTELPPAIPLNKCYSSCIFNLLTDAIIPYMPCSLILMQLFLFIAERFLNPLLLFHLKVPTPHPSLNVCSHLCAKTLFSPIRAALRAELMNERNGQGRGGSSSVYDLLYLAIINIYNIWSHVSYPLSEYKLWS